LGVPEADWIANGLLDPASPKAGERRELLGWLEARGCSIDELVRAGERGQLQSLVGDRKLRRMPTLTREGVAERIGLDVEVVDRVWLAAGFPPAAPGEVAFTEDDLAVFAMVPVAGDFFGIDTLLAFTRVMGASMARVAEAADAMFVTDVEAPRRARGATEVELATTVDEAVSMLAGLPDILGSLFRRHASAAIERSRLVRSASGHGTGADRLRLAVGFADLVGWTALAERHDPRTLALAVGRFERAASERAVAAGVRVVKSIGDAVMVVGLDPVAVVDVMAGLGTDVDADPELTGMRAAVVAGEALARDGDYVGPTVNLAARATKEAPPGGIVVNAGVAAALAAAGRRVEQLEPRRLRGFDDLVELSLVTPA
jgi:class 3 adenylate cyclase